MKEIVSSIIIFLCIEVSSDALVDEFVKKVKVSYPYIAEKFQFPLSNDISNKEFDDLCLKDYLFRLFDGLENGFSIYHKLHLDVVRNSSLAEGIFKDIIETLSHGYNIILERVFVPACGRFYEYKHINELFRPGYFKASDVNPESIDFSSALLSDAKNLQLVNEDITLLQNESNKYDGLFFIHPYITDYDLLGENYYYKNYPSEISMPYKILREQSKSVYLSDVWKLIINNCFDQLKQGGYAFFFFYEHRELDIVLDWLKNKPDFLEIGHVKNNHMLDFSFAVQYLKAIKMDNEEAAEYVSMGAYRAALLIQKIKP